MRELGRCTEQQNKMEFFATRFLKQLEQNDKVPKQITSPYLFVEPRKKDCILDQNRILSAHNLLIMVI